MRAGVCVRAPGKLVWLGDYAVLEGAPALVCSVDRYAIAALRESDDDICRVDAVNIDGAALEFQIVDGDLIWRRRSDKMLLATAVIESAFARNPHHFAPPFCCELDSRQLFAAGGKLGLGSSAAITAALSGALEGWIASPGDAVGESQAAKLRRLHNLHCGVQGGLGSGADMAAALYGGLNLFVRRTQTAETEVREVKMPADLDWCAIYTGRAVSTADYLAALQGWRQREPRQFEAHMDGLTRLANAGADALGQGRTADFVAGVTAYQHALARLGEAAELDIASDEHRRLSALAGSLGVAYKSSGTGGGDLGVAFAHGGGAIARFRDAAHSAGFAVVPLSVADRRRPRATSGWHPG